MIKPEKLVESSNPPQVPSLTLTLEHQKTKYLKLIDRLTTDNKKKAATIRSLQNQLEWIQKALDLAGLELNMKELESLKGEQALSESIPMAAEDLNQPLPSTTVSKQTVPIELVHMPLAHPSMDPPRSQKVMQSLASLGKSYIQHLLNSRKCESDPHRSFWSEDLVQSTRQSSFVSPKKSVLDPFGLSAPSLDGAPSSCTDSDTLSISKKAELNRKQPLPPISNDLLVKKPLSDVTSESTQSSFNTHQYLQAKTHLLQRPCDKQNKDEEDDDASLSQWRSDLLSVPEHLSLLTFDPIKSRYSDKMQQRFKKKLKDWR